MPRYTVINVEFTNEQANNWSDLTQIAGLIKTGQLTHSYALDYDKESKCAKEIRSEAFTKHESHDRWIVCYNLLENNQYQLLSFTHHELDQRFVFDESIIITTSSFLGSRVMRPNPSNEIVAPMGHLVNREDRSASALNNSQRADNASVDQSVTQTPIVNQSSSLTGVRSSTLFNSTTRSSSNASSSSNDEPDKPSSGCCVM